MLALLLSNGELDALGLSLFVALSCVLGSLVPGVFCAWLLARRDFRGKTLFDAVLHLPLVLPPVVTGYVLLLLLGPGSPVGAFLESAFGLRLAFDWKGAVLASAVISFPLLVRAVRLSIELVDPRLELAARTLGAGKLRVFFTVTLPLAAPGVFVGAVLAFARSLGEFGATMIFVSNIEGKTRTLPLAIYQFTQVPGGEGAALRLVLLSCALALLAMLASSLYGRRLEARLGRKAS